MNTFFDIRGYSQKLTDACERYEKTAPTVAAHCDDLYRRIGEERDKVTLAELNGVAVLWEDNLWLEPNYAANTIYHLRRHLGMDTTGHAGF